MNITDIDDKIIKRARQNHLYEQYRNEGHGLAKVLSDCNSVILNFKEVLENTTDPDKRSMQQRLFEKLSSAVQNVAEKVKENDPVKLEQAKNDLLEEAKDLVTLISLLRERQAIILCLILAIRLAR
jgi:cysteinyl-tRNA synthetase